MVSDTCRFVLCPTRQTLIVNTIEIIQIVFVFYSVNVNGKHYVQIVFVSPQMPTVCACCNKLELHAADKHVSCIMSWDFADEYFMCEMS